MKTDYHFHPNLPKRNPTPRLQALWQAIEDHGLQTMICTEHVFKDAPGAYRKLIQARPEHMQTHIFPGAELVTNDEEGIDVIAFGQEDWYEDYPHLLKPFALSLEEMIEELEQTDLEYFIPHPYLIKTALRKRFPTDDALTDFLASVRAYEVFNGAYLPIEQLWSTMRLPWISKKVTATLRNHAHCTSRSPKTASPKFLAVGSDAHHPLDLGFSVEVSCMDPLSRSQAFASIITNTDVSALCFPTAQRLPLLRLAHTGATTLHEGCLRRVIRFADEHQSIIFRPDRQPVLVPVGEEEMTHP